MKAESNSVRATRVLVKSTDSDGDTARGRLGRLRALLSFRHRRERHARHLAAAALLRSAMQGRSVTAGDRLSVRMPSGAAQYEVIRTEPAGAVVPDHDTALEIVNVMNSMATRPIVTYDDVGGLRTEIARVREMVELPLRYPDLFDRLGVDPPRGILFYGPPGSGKTLIARAVAHEAGCHFIAVNGPEIIQQQYGASEAYLRQLFEESAQYPASIIFLDEIDAIAPKRDTILGDLEKRVVAQLLSLMDGLRNRGKIVVIGATNLPNSLDPALRRPGRFDRELHVGPPDIAGRKEILRIHTRRMPLDSDVDLACLAENTHGFLGADLAALCREAAMNCARDALLNKGSRAGDRASSFETPLVGMRDFTAAQNELNLSTTRSVVSETPRVDWAEVGGIDDICRELRDIIRFPLRYGARFQQLNTHPPTGILLTGPSGTGKSLAAAAVGTNSGINFISVKGPELLSKWVGDSERGIRDVFRMARQAAPAIIFIDEIDTLAPQRGRKGNTGDPLGERLVGQLLLEMDAIRHRANVVVLAATNRAQMIDEALLRAGRFDMVLPFSLPNTEARHAIFTVHCRGRRLAADVSLEHLSAATDGMTGADIASLCGRAATLAIRDSIEAQPDEQTSPIVVCGHHFNSALLAAKIRMRDTVARSDTHERNQA